MNRVGFEGAAPLGRSTALLIRLRLRRLHNQLRAASQRKNKAADAATPAKRSGNPGKPGSNVVMYVFMPLMLLGFGSIARTAVINLHEALDPGGFWHTVEFAAPFAVGLAFLLLMLWFSSLLLTIASGELAKSDWDLEWLVTLPIRAETLLWARIIERSVVNPSGFIAVASGCTVIAWYSQHHWAAPVYGLLAAWPLLLLAALVRTLVDTGLRLRMPATSLRNLNAVLSVVSIVTMYLAMSLGLSGKSQFMLGVAASMPDWLVWTPMGLAVLALNERDTLHALLLWAGLAAETLAILWLGIQRLHHQLRHGVVAGGARDAERGATARATTRPATQPATVATGASWLTAVQRRELTLLSRDRNFMVQSLVIPLLIVGGQLLLGSSGVATSMWHEPNVLASVAFGVAAYALSMSAFQTLNTEGHALWLLYTFPCSIEAVLKDKARLWGMLTLAYPLALFCIGLAAGQQLSWKFIAAAVTAFLGIPIYAFIAVALGVFGSNPLEQHQAQKVKVEYVYLYMALSALYIYAVVAPQPFQRIVFIVLSLLLAFALWQKARDRLPYLLDPDIAPPARVSTSDGMIAAMVFFVIQGIVLAIGGVSGATIVVAFSVAGALTYSLMRYVYLRSKTQGVPRIIGDGPSRPLTGLLAGLAAAAVGVAYLLAVRGTPLMEEAQRSGNAYGELGLWVLPLAIVAAPIFEEFIFRGLIFGGLLRSFGLWPAALASAAIFACLHPPISMLPVFGLGLAAALAYARTRSLLAPMLAHATYNTCVIAAQTLLL